MFFDQVQDKFRLDLSDEEAVQYLQALIDESVSAVFASVVEQIHKWAQVRNVFLALLVFVGMAFKYSIRDHLVSGLIIHTFLLLICFDRHTKERPNPPGL